MSDYFIYDDNNNLSIGSVTKTKNGIVVKSHYQSNIKNYCSKWEDVDMVDDCENMESPSYIFFTSPETSDNKIKKIVKEHPDCSILFKKSIGGNIIIGKNMALNLKVCLFHGLDELIVYGDVKNSITEHQKKLFKKIYVKI